VTTSQRPIVSQTNSGIAFLKELFAGVSPRDFAVRFWDGTTWEPEPEQAARFTIVLKHPGAVRNMFWPPNIISVGEAYLNDDFDVEGDMVAYVRFCERLEDHEKTLSLVTKLSYAWRLWRMPKLERTRSDRHAARLTGAVHSLERDRQAIAFHYDLSNEFYSRILDSRMLYTCAVFAHPEEELEAAQVRKLDLVCRKLRLTTGERFLDIGCGWGGLVIHAAKHYGVRAEGFTLSARQAEWAQRKIREAGLEDRCRVKLLDYRDIDEREPYDKIATIEVTEHFGPDQLLTYFNKCWRLLRPQGSLLLQQITLNDPAALRPSHKVFNQAYVFPDGELLSVVATQNAAEKVGFEVRDVEGLREHYVLTLRHWLKNLEAHRDELVRDTSETAYRIFRIYLAASICLGEFNRRWGEFQVLFLKAHPTENNYPLSRADWYANRSS
jgi:cyclopropane-fatty-acyl-phospholipid synthase